MRLTDYTDYTLRTLIHLGLHPDELVTVQQIADTYGISRNHLVKVVHQLGVQGVIQTLRGRGGGLHLALPPEQINLGQIVRMTEPDFNLVECFDIARNQCSLSPACELKNVLARATQAWLGVLDGVTLADLLVRPRQMRQQMQRGAPIALPPSRKSARTSAV